MRFLSPRYLLPLLFFFSVATLAWGSTPWSVLWEGALQRLGGQTPWSPLIDERLPRLLVLICTGASLAVAGAVTQTLFCNPLAAPSILGLTFGSQFCVFLILLLSWHTLFSAAIPLAAVLGCLLTLCLVYASARMQGKLHLQSLILHGIALTTVILAIRKGLLYAFRTHWHLIQTLQEWEAGSTWDRNWTHVHMQVPLTLIGLGGCWFYARELNLLSLGEEEAANLGVQVPLVRWRLFLCLSLLTGGAVAATGVISFFGLLVPHIVRKIQGPHAERLIPTCALVGAISFTGLDFLLRFFHIQMFSIGNISATLGGLFFLTLLHKEHRLKASPETL